MSETCFKKDTDKGKKEGGLSSASGFRHKGSESPAELSAALLLTAWSIILEPVQYSALMTWCVVCIMNEKEDDVPSIGLREYWAGPVPRAHTRTRTHTHTHAYTRTRAQTNTPSVRRGTH